jgi:hypothetical protein
MHGVNSDGNKPERHHIWRKRARRGARVAVVETLRAVSSALGTVAVTSLVIWWQSRH